MYKRDLPKDRLGILVSTKVKPINPNVDSEKWFGEDDKFDDKGFENRRKKMAASAYSELLARQVDEKHRLLELEKRKEREREELEEMRRRKEEKERELELARINMSKVSQNISNPNETKTVQFEDIKVLPNYPEKNEVYRGTFEPWFIRRLPAQVDDEAYKAIKHHIDDVKRVLVNDQNRVAEQILQIKSHVHENTYQRSKLLDDLSSMKKEIQQYQKFEHTEIDTNDLRSLLIPFKERFRNMDTRKIEAPEIDYGEFPQRPRPYFCMEYPYLQAANERYPDYNNKLISRTEHVKAVKNYSDDYIMNMESNSDNRKKVQRSNLSNSHNQFRPILYDLDKGNFAKDFNDSKELYLPPDYLNTQRVTESRLYIPDSNYYNKDKQPKNELEEIEIKMFNDLENWLKKDKNYN